MPESEISASQQRRANWVALRTLRQRARPVGQTQSGDPIFEVRSVRLVLIGDAGTFNRLEQCARCGCDTAGPPVFTQSDLDRRSHSLFCTECARATGPSVSRTRRSVRVKPDPLPPRPRREPPPTPPPPPPPAPPELQVQPPAQPPEPPQPEVEEPAPQPTEPPESSEPPEPEVEEPALEPAEPPGVPEAHELPQPPEPPKPPEPAEPPEAALVEGLAQIRAEITASSQAYAARVEGLEEDVRDSLSRVVERLQAQQSELTVLSGALVDIRSEVQRVTEAHGELARGQGELDRRLHDMAPTDSAEPVAAGVGDIADRLHVLATHVQEVDARIDVLTSAVEEGGSRLDATRLRMQESVDRLTALVEAQRRELRLVAAATPTASPRGPSGDPSGDPPRGPSGPLLDSLERQLQEAERRLGRLATTTSDDG